MLLIFSILSMYSLHTQVLAYSLGLGTLVQDEMKLRRHMKAELQYNDSPYGLLVLTGMNSHYNNYYCQCKFYRLNDGFNARDSIHTRKTYEISKSQDFT